MVDHELQFYFFTISLEIRNRATWDQAHCCFLIFPTFSHSFWKKIVTVAPINGLKLNIISMLTFPEI
ncbi:hypothetical protein T03_13785, partial [Trichinella britovi]